MKQTITEFAKKVGADGIGFAPVSRFGENSVIKEIMPEAKTVIGLLFRVLRGAYRGIEEGSTYYQYSTMGVEALEENVMPMVSLRVAALLEEEGFLALPQRRIQTVMAEDDDVNPEVNYNLIYRGVKKELQMDFDEAAVLTGLGERGLHGKVLNEEYGPFIRYCFILTDAEIEATQLVTPSLCDQCGECIKACPGKAISEDGAVDCWKCTVYYNGANGTKNPFMPPDAYLDFENRLEIIAGEAEIDIELAKKIINATYFYPPAKHFYRTSICGRACDRACYIHLEEKGVLKKKFHKKFREGEDWKLSTKQFETLKREKEWEFTK